MSEPYADMSTDPPADPPTDPPTDPPADPPAARRRFGPVVVLGLAAAGAAALAGSRAWVSVTADDSGSALTAQLAATRDASAPPVTAIALVVLAVWGVLLVARGRFRVGMAWLGLLAALGVLAFAVAAWLVAPGVVADGLGGGATVETHHTFWSYAGVLAAAVAVVAGLGGVRDVRHWPEMGRRYDAPAGGPGGADEPRAERVPPSERESLEVWKELDRGQDPTER